MANTTALRYHQLFESAAVEPCVWRDSEKLQAAFHSPLPPSFMQLLALQGTSQVAQWSRIHLPMQETQVLFLGWEDSLKKELSIYYSILA